MHELPGSAATRDLCASPHQAIDRPVPVESLGIQSHMIGPSPSSKESMGQQRGRGNLGGDGGFLVRRFLQFLK